MFSPAAPSSHRAPRARGAGVTAVLGPTNTGKTSLAIERMLAHSSGLIGLPLRLLAREVYNTVAARAGVDAVALITGEEKIKPANPRYWVATVEAMPRDLEVAFLAVDEIQLGADFERGHVFTDRILNRRGREETLVLGAATVRPMVEKLLPGAHIVGRPRLSQLSFASDKKLTRLPRRSAVVAFSADEVYAIAELIRRQRGGAAVVLGALSPRTRNAQVELYQSGDVDYLVATDAIGMGLNLDVDHVAFASDRKFDGYQFRKLNPAELAQIAGRAGRATRDGTFGTTGRCPPFEQELVQQLEAHSFEPLKLLQWRNTTLDFSSIGALQASLAASPNEQGLTRAPTAEDIIVLEHAARDDDVRALTRTPAAVERLWEVCQVPDYRKVAPASHAELVLTLYGFLMREGTIPTDWFARQVAQADRTDGDIDTLSNRIAHVRTWTFAANRADWLADPEHWQNVTRAVEDKLSDALHARLTERFVDRRTSALMRRLRENAMLEPQISKSGEVMVEGHVIGRLDGFTFIADASEGGSEAKALHNAAQKALASEIDARATRLSEAGDEQFVLATDGAIRWLGQPVGRLVAGDEVLKPRVRVVADEQLSGAQRDTVQARLDLWIKAHVEKYLGPLFALGAAEDITGIARGVAYQLVEAIGVLERHRVADDVKGLDQPTRASLRRYGVRFGAFHLYVPALLKPAPRVLAVQLWALKQGDGEPKGLESILQLAASGRTSIAADKDIDRGLYRVGGYRVCGERALRVDILERLADLIRVALAWRESAPGQKPEGAVDGSGFTVTVAMTSLTGTSGEGFASILRSLGYRMEQRPKPPEAVPEAAAPAPLAETTEHGDTAAADGDAVVISAEPIGEAPALSPSDAPAMPDDTAPAAETEPAVEATAPVASEPDADSGATPDTAEATAAAAAEPEFVEVWRPGRTSERRRRRPWTRPSQRAETAPDQQAADQPQEGGADAAVAAAPAGEEPAIDRPPRHHGRRHERQSGDGQQGERGSGRRPGKRRPSRRDRNEQAADGQADRSNELAAGGSKGRGPRRERRHPFASSGERAPREKQPDPNSPFAKLAALKEQLEANAKERR